MTAGTWRARWTEGDGVRLATAVREWLLGSGPRPGGLAEVDGRTDLRGIPLSSRPFALGDPQDPRAGVVWEGLDLSEAQVEDLRFFGGRISSCRFDGASVTGLRLFGSTVEDASFRRADLRSRALGGGDWHGRRTVWRRVALDRANLRESVFVGCLLERCTFERTTKLLQITDAEVRACTFTGVLTSLLVNGQGHRLPVDPHAFSADLSAAVLRDSTIQGYSLDDVVLPAQEDLLVVRRYPPVVRAAVVLLEAEPDPVGHRAAAVLGQWLRAPGREDSDLCFDLGGFGDGALANAIRRAIEAVWGGAT